MFRRLVADGLVAQAEGRELHLTTGRSDRRRWHLPPPRAARVAADDGHRPRLGRVRRRGDAAPGRHLAARRGASRRDARPPRDLPARQPDRRRDRAPPAGRACRLSEIEAGERATVYRITEEAEEDAGLLSYLEARALMPGAHITILARSESLDSLTLDGPRGRATLGLRPAALVRVLPGEADPGLFHQVPAQAGR